MVDEKKILDLVDKVGKIVGKGKLQCLAAGYESRPCVPFGLPSLDYVLAGGIPEGTMVELFGGEGSGKTTAALHMMGGQARKGRIVIPVDAEHKLDPPLCKMLGVDLEQFPYAQPDTLEEAFEIIEATVQQLSAGDVVLVDSVAALVPKAQMEAGMEANFFGGNAKQIGMGLNKIRAEVSKNGVVVVFINQIREKMGIVYGNPETTPGGRALKHAVSTRIEVRKSTLIKEGDNVIGQNVTIKTPKTGHCFPNKSVTLDLYYGIGFCKHSSLLDLAVELGIINRTGAWYLYGNEKFQGKENAVEIVKTKYDEILEACFNAKSAKS